MELTKARSGETLTVGVTGRLDGYWADHLANELAEVLREGVHRVQLDLSGVSYMSSAGIGTLVNLYKQFDAIQGSLRVVRPSATVRTLLTMTKLDGILIADGAATVAIKLAPAIRNIERHGITFEVFDVAPGEMLTCSAIGDSSLLNGCRFRPEDCRTVTFPRSTFAVGLGAFGSDFTDCRSRFGEFVSVAGAAAYLPTDGTSVPDYMIAAETFVP